MTPEAVAVERRSVWPWVAVALLAAFLDGLVGVGVVVLAAAVWTARLPLRWLVVAGCACLAVVPAVVIAAGLPSPEEVSPDFVMRSTLPHHLMFAGLLLIGIWVVIDLAPHLVHRATTSPRYGSVDDVGEVDADGDAVGDVGGNGPTTSRSGVLGDGALAYVVVALVAVAAIVASLAVLQQ